MADVVDSIKSDLDEKLKQDMFSIIKENKKEVTDEIEIAVEQLLELSKGSSDISQILNWLEDKRKNCPIQTEETGLIGLDKWNVDPNTGVVAHDSGKFFSLIGVKVKGADSREVSSWTQPIMKQQECGILGIIAKKINGIRHYLLYAKYEPGNLHKLQLSPTLQATESNLSLVHGGKRPRFAEYFEGGGKGKILTSVVSVEDGGRFYLKTNRNIIVEVDEREELDITNDYIWVTSAQLKKLLKVDNVVNSLVRSIIGSL